MKVKSNVLEVLAKGQELPSWLKKQTELDVKQEGAIWAYNGWYKSNIGGKAQLLKDYSVFCVEGKLILLEKDAFSYLFKPYSLKEEK